LPAEILERELFSMDTDVAPDAGASWSGGTQRPRLSLRHGSTVLIREILMLPRDLQARLTASLELPVRLLATTALDPEIALEREQLRPELYFVLTTLVVRLQPLRERRDELPALAQHLLERANQRVGKPKTGFSPQALSALLEYHWPGNLRELARVIDHAQTHSEGEDALVAMDDLPASIRGQLGEGYPCPSHGSPIKPLDQLLTEVERRLIETALRQARGNKSRAAELLGISRPRLYRRIKELNLPDDDPPAEADSAH
jgi:DNA-binding NtrC family response regulator